MEIEIRPAVAADVAPLSRLLERSVRALQTADYSAQQIERALASVYGIDTQLVADGTREVAILNIEAGISARRRPEAKRQQQDRPLANGEQRRRRLLWVFDARGEPLGSNRGPRVIAASILVGLRRCTITTGCTRS